MTQPSPETDPLSLLLARAEATLISKRTIASLGNAAPLEQLTAALERALGKGRIHASTVLALAIGTSGGRISARLANQLIPDLDDIEHLAVVAGIVEGDRLGALLDLVAEERVGWERAAVALFLATKLLDGAEPPPRLVSQLRSLAREPLSLLAGMIAGLAARTLKNSEIDTLTARFADVAVLAEFNGLDQKIRDGFFKPVLDSLPDESGGRLVSGYTVVRTEPKVGRNDPCPCGSGRKYKKCCAAREQEPPVEPSRVEQFQKLAGHGARAQDRMFDELRPSELVQVDPATLTTIQLIFGARRLTSHHRWEAAERFLDVLSTRTDAPQGDPREYRVELADEALRAGLLDFAERQMELVGRSESERRRFDLRIALARNAPDALTRLEDLVLEGHNGDAILIADVAFALLDHFPALGILAARGSLNAEHLLDSETLLDSIGHARDRLGLSATEPWEEVFDSWLDGGEYSWIPKPRRGRDDEETTRDDEIERLRADLRQATTRVSRLDGELTRRVQQLDALTVEREKPAVIADASPSTDERRRVAELEGERQRLRTKIAELKGEVSEGAVQRAELRHELARAADAQRRQPPSSTPAVQEDHDHDEAEGDTVAERPRKILAPQFSPSASRALGTLPGRVATEALLETARLAGGDAHAWSGTKHMRRAHEILSARIGRTYRLLFRIEGERLEVLDLIHRRELDNAITRLA